VRGDSIRDLYAKTLALLGLGVLAGTGALVDYWPVGISYPAVGSTLEMPAGAVAIGLTESAPPETPAEPVRAPRISRTPHRVRPIALAPLAVSSPRSVLGGQTIALSEPQLVALTPQASDADNAAEMAIADATAAVARVAETDTSYDPEFPPFETWAPAVVRASETEAGHGFTGAVRRTGSSIVKTGAKTGASIFDAVRVLGGAVRKALPN
jgi:hypothetical protein